MRSSLGRRPRGLTLVELLVSMVILSLVMTLVAQAVYQVGQIVRVADESVIRIGERWRSGWSAQPVLLNLTAPREAGDRPLDGSPTKITGYTTQPPDGSDQGVQAFTLALQRDGSSSTTLTYAAVSTSAAASPQTVARWPGRLEFRYQGPNGQRTEQWPPWTRPARDTALLPNAVLLVEADSGAVVLAFEVPGAGQRQAAEGVNPFGGPTTP